MVKPGTLHTSHEVLMENNHSSGSTDIKVHEINATEKTSGSHQSSESNSGQHGEPHYESVPVNGYFIPGLEDIGVLLGFLALFFGTTLHFLSKASLIPKNDPYLQESIHHHV